MFLIRRIYDDVVPTNQVAIRQVKKILVDQFPGLPAQEVDQLGERLRNPFEKRFRSVLFVAEDGKGKVLGFALLLHDPQLPFCFLDYLATVRGVAGRGVGAALYEHLRAECVALDSKGLWFECLPDEADRCADPVVRKQNAARLKFYEEFDARPIINTAYELPIPGTSSDNVPYLVVDLLDNEFTLRAWFVRKVVRIILERKYADICPPDYVARVVASIRDPVVRRDRRYIRNPALRPPQALPLERIAVALNDKHDIHHVRERGYVEAPVRIRSIQTEITQNGLVQILPVKEYPLDHIRAVHDPKFVDYLERACAAAPEGESIYPYIFPIRNARRPPKDLALQAGYFCIDTFTPIHRNAFAAAKRAVDCTLTMADEILAGRHLAYSLVRPPGHHAERRVFGGFCYFNNAAVAAHYLTKHGRVVILDIDYHHGNGQQEIFYRRRDVLTISIHGDPEFAYPYYTGFADERGAGQGKGFNLNLPLPEVQTGEQYRVTLQQTLDEVKRFGPAFLIVALGLDTAKGDPTGTWLLTARDFELNGRLIGQLSLPTLVVQEGGYRTRTLGINARQFLRGLSEGATGRPKRPRIIRPSVAGAGTVPPAPMKADG
jgi:acetoin utilization deacetylase AcuC-like enzyme/GNAT superfamily N-acetyltransferase